MAVKLKVRDFGWEGIPFGIHELQFDLVQSESKMTDLEILRQWHSSILLPSSTLIVVKSLPYKIYNLDPFLIADSIGFRGERVLEMGANCTTILDALEIAGHYAAYGERTTVVCADRFGDVAVNSTGLDKAGIHEWRNAVGLVQVGPGDRHPAILRVSSKADPSLFDMISVACVEGRDFLESAPEKIAQFRRLDLKNELAVIKSALGSVEVSACLFVVTNRSTDRTKCLAEAIGLDRDQIFSGRDVIGHTGGSDVINNLSRALRTARHGRKHILITANGLGYQWSAALVRHW